MISALTSLLSRERTAEARPRMKNSPLTEELVPKRGWSRRGIPAEGERVDHVAVQQRDRVHHLYEFGRGVTA